MKKNIIHELLEEVDGYLISIKRNVDDKTYELQVGFRKNWVFKSNENIECKVDIESDNGTLVTVSSKHEDVYIDDLIEYVNKVINTNKKITEMQKNFEKELEKQKEAIANKIMEFEDSIAQFKDSSFNKKNDEKGDDEKEVNIEDDIKDDIKETDIKDEKILNKIK